MRVGERSAAPGRSGSRDSELAKVVVAALLAVLVASCSTYRTMSADEKLSLLAELEEHTLDDLVKEHPEAQADLDRAVGYALFSNKATKIPIVGAGDGIGVVVDRRTGERTYLKVGRVDVGGGLGSHTYRLIMVFFDEHALQELAKGELALGAGAEASKGSDEVGTGAGGVAGSQNDEYVFYQLLEGGVSAAWTVNLTRYSVLDLDK